jgi:hypothetical protein
MERYERNGEVQLLRLEDCYITSYEVKRLKEIVVDVIWDGKEIGFDSDQIDDSDGTTH